MNRNQPVRSVAEGSRARRYGERVLSGQQKGRENVDILFGEPQTALRQAFRVAFHREGYRRVVDFDKLRPMREAVARGLPDVLLIDARMDGDGTQVAKMLKDLRFNKFGINPFVNVIVTMWDPEQALVRAMVDAGCDDLLAKPLSPSQIIERIGVLASARKPFVVTSDYIGPDRRKDPSRGSEIPQINVPNTLQAKAEGVPVDVASVKAMVANAQKQINDQKLKRNAFQISFVVRLVLPALEAGRTTPETKSQLQRIIDVTMDIQERMAGTSYAHVSDLCESLLGVSRAIQSALPSPAARDVRLLRPVSDSVLAAFNPGQDSERMAAQIASAISKFEARRKSA